MMKTMKKISACLAAASMALFLGLTGTAAESYPSGGVDMNSDEFKETMRAMYEGTGEYAECPTVRLETNMGDIKIRLFPSEAPKAVENFLTHVEEGYYDGVIFHRIIEGFMIQGGDPDGTGMGGESIWGEGFGVEYSQKLQFLRGSLAMAHSALPDSNGSQFFIVQGNDMVNLPEGVSTEDLTAFLNQYGIPAAAVPLFRQYGGVPFLQEYDGEQNVSYTKFGYVYDGMDIVDKIAAVKTGDSDRPLDDVVIKKAVVTDPEEGANLISFSSAEGDGAESPEDAGKTDAPRINTGVIVIIVVAVVVIGAGVAIFFLTRGKKQPGGKGAAGQKNDAKTKNNQKSNAHKNATGKKRKK